MLNFKKFRVFPVCDTAYRFLRDNDDQPVFNILTMNSNLYCKVKNLRKVRDIRIQASHMWQYIQLCTKTEIYETRSGHGLYVF